MVGLEAAAALGLDARDTDVQRICGANKKRPGITSVVIQSQMRSTTLRSAATAALRVLIDTTPNPRALKFSFAASDDAARWRRGQTATRASAGYVRRSDARSLSPESSPIARLADMLFDLSPSSCGDALVESVFSGPDFVTVESVERRGFDARQSEAIRDAIAAFAAADGADPSAPGSAIERSSGASDAVAEGGDGEDGSAEHAEVVRAVLELIDEKVRPHVQADGGDVEFDRFENGVVYLSLVGACASCPSSTVTVRFMVHNLLTHMIPEVIAVKQTERESTAEKDHFLL
jgi:Fe-S cluster biogenesis protein NfuA